MKLDWPSWKDAPHVCAHTACSLNWIRLSPSSRPADVLINGEENVAEYSIIKTCNILIKTGSVLLSTLLPIFEKIEIDI